MSKRIVVAVAVVTLWAAGHGLRAEEKNVGTRTVSAAQEEFTALHEAYLAKYRPLLLESKQAWWEASITGSDDAFKRKGRMDLALVGLHSDAATFARLKALKKGDRITDPVASRLLDVMYRHFRSGQGNREFHKKIIALQNETEQIFNTHRSTVGGKEISENDVREILADTHDSAKARQAWTGYMDVGDEVAGKLRKLAVLRNQLARELGFENYFTMKLAEQELDPAQLLRIFDELDELTRKPFAEMKKRIDTARATWFGISEAELRPWHFGDLFFQQAPAIQEVNLDELFADQDILALAKTYYTSIGMPVDDILAGSDLYEKPGKTPHAFCEDMDRVGDIRILCNLKANAYWTDTLLHELGHAVYDKYIARDVPFVLRTSSQALTTEGIAMMFGAMTKNEDWLTQVLKVDPQRAAAIAQSARLSLRLEKVIFSRWTQVMVRFEQGLYADPDQNLAKLWWDLKKNYQLLNPPDQASRAGYGAKMHITGAPVYYHNYMMGDLFACQVHAHIAKEILNGVEPSKTSFFNKPKAGAYLRKMVFAPGNLYSWSELIQRATGEPLSARSFARQFVE